MRDIARDLAKARHQTFHTFQRCIHGNRKFIQLIRAAAYRQARIELAAFELTKFFIEQVDTIKRAAAHEYPATRGDKQHDERAPGEGPGDGFLSFHNIVTVEAKEKQAPVSKLSRIGGKHMLVAVFTLYRGDVCFRVVVPADLCTFKGHGSEGRAVRRFHQGKNGETRSRRAFFRDRTPYRLHAAAQETVFHCGEFLLDRAPALRDQGVRGFPIGDREDDDVGQYEDRGENRGKAKGRRAEGSTQAFEVHSLPRGSCESVPGRTPCRSCSADG